MATMMKKNPKGSDTGNGNIIGRYILIAGFIVLWAVGICYFLGKNSLVDSAEWIKAEKEIHKTRYIEPIRGEILARDGSTLATNEIRYNAVIHYRQIVKDSTFISLVPAFSDSLAKYFPKFTKQQWVDTILAPFKEPVKEKRRKYFRIITEMTHEQYEAFMKFPLIGDCGYKKPFRYLHQTGISIEPVKDVRVYPYEKMARRSIGKTGMMSLEDLKKIGKGEEFINRKFGLYGLEEALDSLLYGKQGVSNPKDGVKGYVYVPDIKPVNGFTVQSTIDITLQDLLDISLLEELDAQERKPKKAIAMLMDVKTGDLLAVSNYDYSNGKYIEAMNYAFESRYDPGSLLKTLTLIIALEDKLIPNINTPIPVTPIMGQSHSHFNTSSATASDIIMKSSNPGMIHMLFMPGSPYPSDPDKYIERLKGLGLMEPLNIGNSKETRLKYPSKMNTQYLAQMAFGYCLDFPPVLMMSIYNAIANDGKFVRPRLYTQLISEDTIIDNPVSYFRPQICSPDNARQVREALRTVVGEHGTGIRLKNCVVPLAGKTGTAMVYQTEKKGDKEVGFYSHDLWRYTFCGFFPYESPRYTIYVMFNEVNVPEGVLSVGRTAGQVVLRMTERMYARGYLGDGEMNKDIVKKGDKPKVFRSADEQAYDAASEVAGFGKSKAVTQKVEKGVVPNVIAMGLTEAIKTIEDCGLNVSPSGTGFVANQIPAPGTRVAEGSTVVIHLKQ